MSGQHKGSLLSIGPESKPRKRSTTGPGKWQFIDHHI